MYFTPFALCTRGEKALYTFISFRVTNKNFFFTIFHPKKMKRKKTIKCLTTHFYIFLYYQPVNVSILFKCRTFLNQILKMKNEQQWL